MNGRIVFLKVISHVSAILGPNPYTGKVESEQEIVLIKERVEKQEFFILVFWGLQ